MITKCGNTACSSGNTTTQISDGDTIGRFTSLAIGADGLPIIAYRNQSDTDLMITKCADSSCVGATGTALTGGSQLGGWMANPRSYSVPFQTINTLQIANPTTFQNLSRSNRWCRKRDHTKFSNVGIGTTSPGKKLDVVGDLRVDGGSNPVLKGNWYPDDTNVMQYAVSVYVSGKYAYVAGDGSDNLAIVDISNPASPTTTGNWDPNDTNVMNGAHSVYISGKCRNVAGYVSSNLAIVDISNPASPTTIGNWDPNDTNVMYGAYSVYVSGKYAYVAGEDSDNLAIVDISNPASPTTIGNWDPNDTNVMNGASSKYVSGKYAYVAGDFSSNLAIVDISNPANPTTIGNWDPNDANVMNEAVSVYVSGKYAYVTGEPNPTTLRLWILAILLPPPPQATGIPMMQT